MCIFIYKYCKICQLYKDTKLLYKIKEFRCPYCRSVYPVCLATCSLTRSPSGV